MSIFISIDHHFELFNGPRARHEMRGQPPSTIASASKGSVVPTYSTVHQCNKLNPFQFGREILIVHVRGQRVRSS